ncbi:unnamed protein product [Hydatigera taeniaeformis]|uniref:Expressed conserved protein n=1 Tax=Hydatigena taeniaeformis TaxID=6205 RepID=A0A0R3X7Z8_HYDTA|nr:unnamed protein product [Hydatigera taeniaeformis]
MKNLDVVCSDTSSGCYSDNTDCGSCTESMTLTYHPFPSSLNPTLHKFYRLKLPLKCMTDICPGCISKSANRRIKLKYYEPIRLWKCHKNCTEPGIQLVDPRGPCCSRACRGRMSSFSSRSCRPHPQMYGIQLTSPEPFMVEYPRNSPIHAVMPRSVSPKSPVYRRSPPIIRRSPSPSCRRGSPRFLRRSPSLRCQSPASLHRSLSIDRRSRPLHIRRTPYRSRSYADYAYEEEEEELVGRGGGKYIYVNPDYIRRYHGRRGVNESFSSSGSIDQPRYHRDEILSSCDY